MQSEIYKKQNKVIYGSNRTMTEKVVETRLGRKSEGLLKIVSADCVRNNDQKYILQCARFFVDK